MNTIHYYESHITIEPVFEERLELFSSLAKANKFQAAKLLMQKTRSELPVRSNKDSFCTGHAASYEDLHNRMVKLTNELREAGFEVWRAKIEGILFDEKYSRGIK